MFLIFKLECTKEELFYVYSVSRFITKNKKVLLFWRKYSSRGTAASPRPRHRWWRLRCVTVTCPVLLVVSPSGAKPGLPVCSRYKSFVGPVVANICLPVCSLSFHLFLKIMVDLQWRANFCCTRWHSHTYLPMHSLSYVTFHRGLSQETGYSSLCYSAGPHCLSFLNFRPFSRIFHLKGINLSVLLFYRLCFWCHG